MMMVQKCIELIKFAVLSSFTYVYTSTHTISGIHRTSLILLYFKLKIKILVKFKNYMN